MSGNRQNGAMEAPGKKSAATLAHRAEYCAVRAFECLFRVLPYSACILLGKGLAWLAFHVFHWRRREAARRFSQVFPGTSRREIDRQLWRSTETLFLNIAELMHMHGLDDGWIDRHVENCGAAMGKLRSATKETGAILALPHFGNWDLAGMIVAHSGMPIFSVAGIQKNPLTNDWINHKRSTGISILERGTTALRQTVKRLKNREIFAILPDVRMKTPDLAVPFLGGTANLGRGMAVFARKTGVPILVADVRRKGAKRHWLDVSEPIWPNPAMDEEADVMRITKTVMEAIELQIRSDPGQWFWFNKRWVLDPIL